MNEEKITVDEKIWGPGPTPSSKVLLAVPGDIVTASTLAAWTEPPTEADPDDHSGQDIGDARAALEARAAELGVEFRSNISDATLAERIDAAEQAAQNDDDD